MSMGDKRRHKRNIQSNGRDNIRMKKKYTRGKTYNIKISIKNLINLKIDKNNNLI